MGKEAADAKMTSGFSASVTYACSLQNNYYKYDPPATQETQVRLLGGEDSLGEGTQPIPVFLPGESHSQEEPGRL